MVGGSALAHACSLWRSARHRLFPAAVVGELALGPRDGQPLRQNPRQFGVGIVGHRALPNRSRWIIVGGATLTDADAVGLQATQERLAHPF
jgi:hypothetical protein